MYIIAVNQKQAKGAKQIIRKLWKQYNDVLMWKS